jgi:inhibitor of cysteine peptidase
MDLDSRSSGQSIELGVGERLTVRLDENPTTGYRWTAVGTFEPVLVLINSDFELPTGQLRYGAGGVRSWTFEAAQTGTAKLRMEYTRASSQDPEQRTYFLSVRVT